MLSPKREKQVNVRLNHVEYAKLEAFAEEEGVTVSEAVRLLIQKLPKPQKTIDANN